MEVDPGALGEMNTGARDSFGGDTSNGYGFEEEPPLLEGDIINNNRRLRIVLIMSFSPRSL